MYMIWCFILWYVDTDLDLLQWTYQNELQNLCTKKWLIHAIHRNTLILRLPFSLKTSVRRHKIAFPSSSRLGTHVELSFFCNESYIPGRKHHCINDMYLLPSNHIPWLKWTSILWWIPGVISQQWYDSSVSFTCEDRILK